MDRDINFNYPAAPHLPILGEGQRPILMTINIYITPKLMDRLVKWQEEVGVTVNEIGGTIARIGLVEFSKRVDDPEDRINHPEQYLGPPQGPAE